MASNPLVQLSGGILGTTPINNLDQYVNVLFAGLAQSQQVSANADLTLTTTETDVPGVSIPTLTVAGSNAFAVCIGTFDFDASATGSAVAQGRLSIDGATQTMEAHGPIASVARVTAEMTWLVPLLPGSHALKLRAAKSGAVGTVQTRATHTNLTVILVDLP
jgi:hypothetical protein